MNKDSAERHPQSLSVDVDELTLAELLSNLRYDALSDYLLALSARIKGDAAMDERRGRARLSAELVSASDSLRDASESIQRAWDLYCKERTR